jgi:hypothetical protein
MASADGIERPVGGKDADRYFRLEGAAGFSLPNKADELRVASAKGLSFADQ